MVRRARSTHRRVQLWQLHLAVGALLCGLFLFVPPFRGSGPLMNLLGLSPVVAIAVGVRLHRPASATPWWCFAAGFGLFWLGDLYTIGYSRLFDEEVPFPSAGDALYLVVYPVLMAGLLVLVRRRNPEGDRAGVIDALIMSLGLGLVFWVTLVAPGLHADDMTVLAKLVSAAYPVGDVLLLAAAIRLALDTGKRRPAFYLIATSIVALLVTDYVYGLVTLQGAYTGQLGLDFGWIAFYLLWGAAALHPSMREIDQASPDREAKLTPVRLALLTGAAIVSPVAGLMLDLEAIDNLIVVNVASILLFGLVVVRMSGLLRQQERSVDRERILSAGGVALVAATRHEEIHHAALEAARALVGGQATALLCSIDDGRLRLVAAARKAAPERCDAVLPERTAAELCAAAEADDVVTLGAEACAALTLDRRASRATVLGLRIRGELGGLLIVACEANTRAVRRTLQALATQTSLALERAALSEEVLRRTSEARFSSLVQHASDLISVLDADGTVLYQSPSITRVLGYAPEEIVGTRFDRLLEPGEEGRLLRLLTDGSPGGETGSIECALRHRDGSSRQFEILHTDLLENEHVGGIVLNGRDVSERKAFEAQLAHAAFHDPVTGLANRALFVERVRHAIARSRRDAVGPAVIFVDLDDFKAVNDSLGHEAGDQVLFEVAQRLAASIRASDTAARFGGDEFAVLLEEVAGAHDACETAERIVRSLLEPLGLEHKQLAVRCSLGIALFDGESSADAEALIRNADAAMYVAKREGKGAYCVFEPAMHAAVLDRLELRSDLQRALTSGELELHYQPVVRLADGTIAGVEALLRWRHPERGLVPPDAFIPLAEEMGLIVPIGRWVLREGCRQAKAFQAALPSDMPLSMSLNLSVKQLEHSDVVADVRDALHETGLDAHCLTLEITESVMITNAEIAVARLEELKAIGVRLAMDDFGTGYSSLSHLSQLPVDVLKMDRSFMRAGVSPEHSGLATAVLALGETLQLEVVAEGIERPDQWLIMRDLGCHLGQGHWFAKPMAVDAALEFLRARRDAPLPIPELAGVDAA